MQRRASRVASRAPCCRSGRAAAEMAPTITSNSSKAFPQRCSPRRRAACAGESSRVWPKVAVGKLEQGYGRLQNDSSFCSADTLRVRSAGTFLPCSASCLYIHRSSSFCPLSSPESESVCRRVRIEMVLHRRRCSICRRFTTNSETAWPHGR